ARRAARLVDDDGRSVPADVEEGPQVPLLVPEDQDRLAGDGGGDERARLAELLDAGRRLPGAAEDRLALGSIDFRIGVPGAGNSPRLLERQLGIEQTEFVRQGRHGCSIVSPGRGDTMVAVPRL